MAPDNLNLSCKITAKGRAYAEAIPQPGPEPSAAPPQEPQCFESREGFAIRMLSSSISVCSELGGFLEESATRFEE